MPFAPQPSRSPRKAGPGLLALPGRAAHAAWDLTALTPRLLRMGEGLLREQAAAGPLQAPRSILNVPITGSRRFAAEAWPMDRLKAVGTAAGATLNDVLLAMCSSALRSYLADMDALPDRPLIAMTPVSLRGDDDEGGGNAVGTILCNLATDVDDAADRLMSIRASMLAGKDGLAGLSQLQVTALSAAMLSPFLLSQLPAIGPIAPPAYNLVISNVPGPQQPLYWNGARLDGMYPLSIPLNGQALNITVTSYAGQVEFGLIGCRRTLPHLQRLLGGLEDALVDLEKAFS
jgi:WS/DGAT/MGAT family acyltransferase